MRCIVPLFLCFLLPPGVSAQVNLALQLPPGGMIQQEQLWNLTSTNNTGSSFEAMIMLELQETVSGRSVMVVSSSTISLPAGTKRISGQDLQPFRYSGGVAGYTGQFIPLGVYTACYTLVKLTGGAQEQLVKECAKITISPLMPPMLLQPADRSVLYTQYPQFNWTAPGAVNSQGETAYDLNIVEVQDGQSANDAISGNTSVYRRSFLRVPMEDLAISKTRLDNNKTYAWQIRATNGSRQGFITEVRTFRISGDPANTEIEGREYIRLNAARSGVVVIPAATPRVDLQYHSIGSSFAGSFSLYDASRNLVKEFKRTISTGDNFISLDVDGILETGKPYQLIFSGDKGMLAAVPVVMH